MNLRPQRAAVVAGAFLFCLPLGSGAVRADHHLLKRALQEARCIPASATRVAGEASVTAYEVVCRGAPRNLVVVCDARACRAETADHHDRADDES